MMCVQRNNKKLFNIAKNSDQSFTAAFLKSNIWPKKSIITISFLPTIYPIPNWTNNYLGQNKVDPIEYEIRKLTPIDAIKKVVTDRIIPIVDLDIRFVDSNGMVRISLDGTTPVSSWSYVGTDCLNYKQNEATMNFGWLDAATIMHEFGHLLGMIHEHQNPNGEKIQWDKEKVYEWAKRTQGWDKQTTDENILDFYNTEQLNTTEFDPNSIMLYYYPADLTLNNKGTHANYRLSQSDVLYINKMYPESKLSPSEFYMKVYNEKITSVLKDFSGSESKPDLTNYLIIGICVLLVIVGISYFIYSK